MTKTLYVKRPDVWRMARYKAIRENVSLAEIVEALLQNWIVTNSALDKLVKIRQIIDE